MIALSTVSVSAERRKSVAEPAALMPTLHPRSALVAPSGARDLAEVAKRHFSGGFLWSVIESMRPRFKEALPSFDPTRLVVEPDEF